MKIPAPETPRWSQEQAPAPDDSSCLTVAGWKVTNPPKRWQFPRTGGQILSTNIWEMSGSYTRFCLCVLGVLLLNLYIYIYMYVDCFFLSTTIMRAILHLNQMSGGIPNCEVASHAASHGTRNPRLEPLKLISNTCHGTFRTKPWNPPKPFATSQDFWSIRTLQSFPKTRPNPTFQIPLQRNFRVSPLESLYPKPSKLRNLPFLFTTTWPSHLPNRDRNLRCLKTENLNHHLPTIPIRAASRPGRWPQSSRRHKGVHQTSSWSA